MPRRRCPIGWVVLATVVFDLHRERGSECLAYGTCQGTTDLPADPFVYFASHTERPDVGPPDFGLRHSIAHRDLRILRQFQPIDQDARKPRLHELLPSVLQWA